MVRINGKTVSDGIAIGRIVFLNKEHISVKDENAENSRDELEKYRAASYKVSEELIRLEEKARRDSTAESAEIFEIHRMMLCDRDFVESIEKKILDENKTAEYAVWQTAQKFSKTFFEMDSEYMRGRAADIIDISERMVRVMRGESRTNNIKYLEDRVIVCADDLSPSETVQMDKSKVMALATRYGSLQSHTAILARTMNIPAVIGLGEALSNEYEGMTAVVDGERGCVYIEPTLDVIEYAREASRLTSQHKERLRLLRGMDNITLDGRQIMVYSNIGSPGDLDAVLENDAGGVGLFRSEFLYLKSRSFPTEEDQFKAYKTVIGRMNGKKVIIRTLDVGADKNIDYMRLDKEENPALGFRAIRVSLAMREMFKIQLRALLRASVYGKLSIMIPMVISVDEIRRTRAILNEVKTELRNAGIPFDNAIELGIMIETPAAVMISDILAREADFFSIGSNDLTQYTLAIDRQNSNLEPYYDPYHPAILRMIRKTVESAHRARIWCGICGELATDLSMTETFLALDIDELSVPPAYILPLREKIRSINVGRVKDKILDGI